MVESKRRCWSSSSSRIAASSNACQGSSLMFPLVMQMVYDLLPPELWRLIGEIMNRVIEPTEDSIKVTLPHPMRYEIIFNERGEIREIRECSIS